MHSNVIKLKGKKQDIENLFFAPKLKLKIQIKIYFLKIDIMMPMQNRWLSPRTKK